MDDIHLDPFSFSVDNSDLLEAFLLTFEKVVLQERGDLPGGKSMEVNPILDRNLNNHDLNHGHSAERMAHSEKNRQLKTHNSKLSTFNLSTSF